MIDIKKRAMKKWIPKGMYCYEVVHCKWHKHVGTKKINNTNCELSNTCRESDSDCNCSYSICKCEYMNYIDFNQDSLLWDSCKECGVKDK